VDKLLITFIVLRKRTENTTFKLSRKRFFCILYQSVLPEMLIINELVATILLQLVFTQNGKK